MDEQIKLLDCPFCGGRNIACETFDDGWKFVDVCRGCRARGPVYRTMIESLKGWNTRHATRRDAELVERMEAGRHYLMSVDASAITAEDALEAFGFGRNGLA